jgi:succinate dehydrogenase/fumarate reductase cytochrome b subunit
MPRAKETVRHPTHYGGDTVYEVIKVIEAWKLGFHLGNAVKYIARAGKKDKAKVIEDLRKAIWYIERFITILEKS